MKRYITGYEYHLDDASFEVYINGDQIIIKPTDGHTSMADLWLYINDCLNHDINEPHNVPAPKPTQIENPVTKLREQESKGVALNPKNRKNDNTNWTGWTCPGCRNNVEDCTCA